MKNKKFLTLSRSLKIGLTPTLMPIKKISNNKRRTLKPSVTLLSPRPIKPMEDNKEEPLLKVEIMIMIMIAICDSEFLYTF